MAGERSAFRTFKWRTESAFGVSNGSWSGVSPLPIIGVPRQALREEPIPDETVRTDLGANKPIPGPKSGSTWGVDLYGTGLGTAGTGSVSSTAMAPGLASVIGTVNNDTGDVTANSPTVSAIDIASSNITSGMVAGFALPTLGTVWRPVTRSSATLTPLYNLPEAPSGSAANVYATSTFLLDNDYTEAQSIQAEHLTDRSDNKFEMLGMFADTLVIELTAGRPAVVKLDGQMVNWVDTPTSSLASPTLPTKQLFMDSELHLVPYSGGSPVVTFAAGNQRALRGTLTLTFTRGQQGRPDPHATQAVSMWDTPGTSVLGITMTLPADDEYRDAYSAETDYSLFCSVGRTAGSVFGFFCTKLHLTADPGDPIDDNGILAHNTSWAMTRDYTNSGFGIFQG